MSLDATQPNSGPSSPRRVSRTASPDVSNEEREKRGLMLPPPVPSKASGSSAEKPKPPRMTRLPSLKQLSDHLNYTPTTPSSQQLNPFDQMQSSTSGSTGPLSISTNPSILQGTSAGNGTSPIITPSPSGRLKLPASAMMRTLSSGSNAPLPTIVSSPKVATGMESAQEPARYLTHASTPSGTLPVLGKNGLAGFGDFQPDRDSPSPSPGPSREGGSATSMSRTASGEGYIKGYRDVPTLDEIRKRVSVTKGGDQQRLAIPAGSVKPKSEEEEAKKKEGVEKNDEKSPASSQGTFSVGPEVDGKKKEHSLQHAWTLYYDSKTYKPDASAISAMKAERGGILAEWEMTLLTVGKFDTVEGFARHLNNVRLPGQLNSGSNYHLFKNGIRPMWEDPANANGGKWVILFRQSPGTLDLAWANLAMALVGNMLDPEDQVCGIVASARPKIDRLQVWTRGKDDIEGLNSLGKRIAELMGLDEQDSESMSMEFQYNSDAKPPPNKFVHISGKRGPATPSRPVSSAFQGPPATLGGDMPSPRTVPGGHNLTHPLPLPPHSPSVTGGYDASSGTGAKRGLSGTNPFAGPLGMARQGSHGVTGV